MNQRPELEQLRAREVAIRRELWAEGGGERRAVSWAVWVQLTVAEELERAGHRQESAWFGAAASLWLEELEQGGEIGFQLPAPMPPYRDAMTITSFRALVQAGERCRRQIGKVSEQEDEISEAGAAIDYAKAFETRLPDRSVQVKLLDAISTLLYCGQVRERPELALEA